MTETNYTGKLISAAAEPVSGIVEPTPPDGPHDARETAEIIHGVRLINFADTKKVVKQWGQERWLHETDSPFGFKVIRIGKGRRTSLQFHRHKRETYFILNGVAVLHLRDGTADVRVPFPAGTVAHVAPGAIHRVEAATDVILVEASTYDDGSDNVRIEDDYGRGDGIVTEEHEEHREEQR